MMRDSSMAEHSLNPCEDPGSTPGPGLYRRIVLYADGSSITEDVDEKFVGAKTHYVDTFSKKIGCLDRLKFDQVEVDIDKKVIVYRQDASYLETN